MLLSSKEKLIASMKSALVTQGYHAAGLASLLAGTELPKGSLYHHFPKGKSQLAVAAIESLTADFEASFEKQFEQANDPVEAIRSWVALALRRLQKSQFVLGCPFATVTLEVASVEPEIGRALDKAFASLRRNIAHAFSQAGYRNADSVAALVVSTYEGALIQARAMQSTRFIESSMATLCDLLLQNKVRPIRKPSKTRSKR
jgi:TetR/AcrR family transcriptional regulator, lmrAB and yxaGH operons repressor